MTNSIYALILAGFILGVSLAATYVENSTRKALRLPAPKCEIADLSQVIHKLQALGIADVEDCRRI